MKKFLTSLLALTFTFTILPFASVKAEETENSKIRNEVIQAFIEDGLEEEEIEVILEKIDDGETLDSINPESEPISEEITFDLYGNQTEKLIFEDGSYSLTSIILPNSILPLSLGGNFSGGTITSGSGYQSIKGALVYHSLGIFRFGYNVDYTFVAGGNSYISRAYNEYYTETVSKAEVGVYRTYQSGSTPALACLQFKYINLFYSFNFTVLGTTANASLEYL